MGFRAELHPEAGILIYRDFEDQSSIRTDFGSAEATLRYPFSWEYNLPGGSPSPSLSEPPAPGTGLTREQAIELSAVLIKAAAVASLEIDMPASGELRDFLDGFAEVTLKR